MLLEMFMSRDELPPVKLTKKKKEHYWCYSFQLPNLIEFLLHKFLSVLFCPVSISFLNRILCLKTLCRIEGPSTQTWNVSLLLLHPLTSFVTQLSGVNPAHPRLLLLPWICHPYGNSGPLWMVLGPDGGRLITHSLPAPSQISQNGRAHLPATVQEPLWKCATARLHKHISGFDHQS